MFAASSFLEPLRHFEQRLHKAFASSASEMMNADL